MSFFIFLRRESRTFLIKYRIGTIGFSRWFIFIPCKVLHFVLTFRTNIYRVTDMSSKLKIMLAVICLSFAGLVYATDECEREPCEEGDPNCGGEPGGDSMSMVLEE